MGVRARSYWVVEPGLGELRETELPEPAVDEVQVRAVHSGISRGTESLVFLGRVPAELRERMRAPFQEGEFPGPVKYGYLSVGVVERGPDELLGRTVFCLHPHQTAYVVPAAAVTPVPEAVPARRAVLAGTVETAVNALWDAAPLVGDRIAVVGAGMVGCCVARLLAGIPGTTVTLVDHDPSRAAVAGALDVGFALPPDAPDGLDLVFHASASSAGLQTALDLLGVEGVAVDLSWYGDRRVEVGLGGAFHDRRLTLRSSQVGRIAPARAARRGFADRLGLALDLLGDPAYDALLTGSSPLRELPEMMAELAGGYSQAICHTVTYDDEGA